MQIEVADARLSLGERIRKHYRAKYQHHAAKRLARITGTDLRTARGHVEEAREPRGEALLAIIRDLGRDGLLALFSPEVEAHEEQLARRINELREEAARLEKSISTGRNPAENFSDAGQDRPPPGNGTGSGRDG